MRLEQHDRCLFYKHLGFGVEYFDCFTCRMRAFIHKAPKHALEATL